MDIDGVLNSGRDHEELVKAERYKTGKFPDNIKFYNRGDWVVVDKVNLLRECVKELDAQVVIVSSWCIGDDYKAIHEFLGLPEHSKAFNNGGGLERGRGVVRHAEHYGIDLEDYAIIDDSWLQMYEDRRRCVPIDSFEGLNEHMVEYIKLLFGVYND